MLIDFLKLVRVASLPALAAVVAAAPSQALEWQKGAKPPTERPSRDELG